MPLQKSRISTGNRKVIKLKRTIVRTFEEISKFSPSFEMEHLQGWTLTSGKISANSNFSRNHFTIRMIAGALGLDFLGLFEKYQQM